MNIFDVVQFHFNGMRLNIVVNRNYAHALFC